MPTERQPRKRKEPLSTPEHERRIQFSEVTIAAWTGEVSGAHLYDPKRGYGRGSTTGMYQLERALPDLADGGYVIDLRPLADNPNITTWVFNAPMPSGRIEGADIDRLPDSVRQAGAELAFGLGDAYQDLALLASVRAGEPIDGSAGPFDNVSAAYRAVYWSSRGALVGKRVGNTLQWSDGKEQAIAPRPVAPKPQRRTR